MWMWNHLLDNCSWFAHCSKLGVLLNIIMECYKEATLLLPESPSHSSLIFQVWLDEVSVPNILKCLYFLSLTLRPTYLSCLDWPCSVVHLRLGWNIPHPRAMATMPPNSWSGAGKQIECTGIKRNWLMDKYYYQPHLCHSILLDVVKPSKQSHEIQHLFYSQHQMGTSHPWWVWHTFQSGCGHQHLHSVYPAQPLSWGHCGHKPPHPNIIGKIQFTWYKVWLAESFTESWCFPSYLPCLHP